MADAYLVEYVANVSEGQRLDVVRRIADAACGPGVSVLDVHSDPDHNRSVITVVGSVDAIEASALRLATEAITQIDLRQHRGTHPRIGALDVLPFVPLGATPMATCVALAHDAGRQIAATMNVPVYFYGEAALREERRLLVNIRRGEYEGLAAAISSDPSRWPDAGPRSIGPAGAVAVGSRPPLIAMNVHLCTEDLAMARAIARTIRASSGGLPGVQALGLPTSRPGIVQISMNLTNFAVSPPHVVVDAIRGEAARRGIALAETELVGLIPAAAALAAAASSLGLLALDAGQVLEWAAREAMDR
ncbi:MAG TPA: glutamate formimidoyltransferase [Chloroflexota bacterium]|nr:glutamate formimidoyltransferase [Chloroflexota bacterium]